MTQSMAVSPTFLGQTSPDLKLLIHCKVFTARLGEKSLTRAEIFPWSSLLEVGNAFETHIYLFQEVLHCFIDRESTSQRTIYDHDFAIGSNGDSTQAVQSLKIALGI